MDGRITVGANKSQEHKGVLSLERVGYVKGRIEVAVEHILHLIYPCGLFVETSQENTFHVCASKYL